MKRGNRGSQKLRYLLKSKTKKHQSQDMILAPCAHIHESYSGSDGLAETLVYKEKSIAAVEVSTRARSCGG
jgi:Icc-related predicted phosphoesterase